MKNLFKTTCCVFLLGIFFLSSCDDKRTRASQDFGSGKNFFEAYGIKTEGTYISGRVVTAEREIINKVYGIYIKLDNGKEFLIAFNDIYKSSPFRYSDSEEEKKLSWDRSDDYDAETVKNLYVEAIIGEDGISYQFVYYNYESHQRALAFMKNDAKTKTEKSSLEITDYKKNEFYGAPTGTGKSRVIEIVEYYGFGHFLNYYLSDGTILTLSHASKEHFCDQSKKSIEKGDVVSYVLSDMTGSHTREKNPYTNILDYVVE